MTTVYLLCSVRHVTVTSTRQRQACLVRQTGILHRCRWHGRASLSVNSVASCRIPVELESTLSSLSLILKLTRSSGLGHQATISLVKLVSLRPLAAVNFSRWQRNGLRAVRFVRTRDRAKAVG